MGPQSVAGGSMKSFPEERERETEAREALALPGASQPGKGGGRD